MDANTALLAETLGKVMHKNVLNIVNFTKSSFENDNYMHLMTRLVSTIFIWKNP